MNSVYFFIIINLLNIFFVRGNRGGANKQRSFSDLGYRMSFSRYKKIIKSNKQDILGIYTKYQIQGRHHTMFFLPLEMFILKHFSVTKCWNTATTFTRWVHSTGIPQSLNNVLHYSRIRLLSFVGLISNLDHWLFNENCSFLRPLLPLWRNTLFSETPCIYISKASLKVKFFFKIKTTYPEKKIYWFLSLELRGYL